MRTATGFTLIEQLVTLAILAIVLAISAPSLTRWLAAQRLSGATEAVADTLRQARKRAITGQQLIFLSSQPGKHWTLSADASTTTTCDAALLCVDGSDYRGITLSANETALALSPLKALPYKASGAPTSATFTLSQVGCSDSKVILLSTGFVATEYGRCN
ncbi:pilus assembly FimT family protein [Craterilacuibacter sp.]|uniref:pilus assembly FimT family protein n=1 Tax=Craterilacuibacter sp. TaxID=2870909 RepID=UPI003F34E4D7